MRVHPNEFCTLSLPAQAPEEITLQVQSAKIIRPTTPEYPPLAQQSRVEGTHRLEAIIDKNGNVQELKVLSGHPVAGELLFRP